MTRTVLSVVVLGALFLGGLAVPGHGQEARPKEQPKQADPKADAEKTKAIMRKKVEHSQKILEALALNDLEAAGKNAEALIQLRKDPLFKTIKTPEYELWSDEFTRSAEGVSKAAKDKNLEAAKLHYLGMTMSCFHCHAYTRDQRKKID